MCLRRVVPLGMARARAARAAAIRTRDVSNDRRVSADQHGMNKGRHIDY